MPPDDLPLDHMPLDHLVLATPDLADTTAWFAEQTGVTPTTGGQHVGFGTRNVLVALSDTSYLEIVGPDPEQDEPSVPRPFGIDGMSEARLVTFAVKATNLAAHVERCAAGGVDIGVAADMSREKPDGSLLEWSLTMAAIDSIRPLPFLIDWRGAPSPALTSAQGVSLVSMSASHPTPSVLRNQLGVLGIELDVVQGEAVALEATLSSPAGSVTLR